MTVENKVERKNVKIVVVDDEPIMLNLACDALKSEGYQVVPVSRASQALEKLRQEEFDFILTDIKMPEMDGLELVQAAHQINPQLGAIFMTGYASVDTAKRAVREGAYDYILKPFDLFEIRKAVNNAVEKRKEKLENLGGNELKRLFDLNKLLYTAGDKRGLLKLSLAFALMRTETNRGFTITWEEEGPKALIILTSNVQDNIFEESNRKINRQKICEWFGRNDLLQTSTPSQHLILSSLEDQDPPELFSSEEQITVVPIKYQDRIFGILSLNQKLTQSDLSESDLKFLAILATQTAISFENMSLLEESRKSYEELKNLQNQLIQLEKMASRGQMSAEIGHELNNYLGVVMGNFQLLSLSLEKKDMDKANKYLKAIEDNLEQMNKFTCGLMDFSSMLTEKKECNLNELIKKVIGFVNPQNRFRNISFKKELQDNLPELLVDGGQMQQVFYNLLNNAADAMGKRKGEGGTITVKTAYHVGEKMVEIDVADTGMGMSEEELEKVFAKSFTTKSGGHGFGLLACKRIVANHNGKIEVESQKGKGTTFKIKLPFTN